MSPSSLRLSTAVLILLLSMPVAAQGLTRYEMAGRAVASQFAWSVKAQVASPPEGGAGQITFDVPALTLSDEPSFEPWQAGVPVLVQDGVSTETVVLSDSQCSIGGSGTCEATADFAFGHNGPFTVQSASGGLQEAIDYLRQGGGGTVLLTRSWAAQATSIAAAIGDAAVQIEDTRGGATRWYTWSGGGYVPAALNASGGQLSAREIESQVYADQFPGTDIGAQVNNAIAALTGGCGTVVLPAGVLSFSTTILKPRCVVIRGQSRTATLLRYTGAGAAVIIADNAGHDPLQADSGGLSHLTLRGPGAGTASVGVYLGGDPSGTVSPSGDWGNFQIFQNVRVQMFGTAYQFGNNSWLDVWRGGMIDQNGTGIYFPDGLRNSGEALDFYGGQFDDNGVALNAQGATDDFYFYGTSFDFSGPGDKGQGPAIVSASGNPVIQLFGCHLESVSGPMISITGGGTAILDIYGGVMAVDATSGSDPYLIGFAGTNSSLVVDGIFLDISASHPISELVDFTATGSPLLDISNLPPNGGSYAIAPVQPGLAPFTNEHIANVPGNGYSLLTADGRAISTQLPTAAYGAVFNALDAPTQAGACWHAAGSPDFLGSYNGKVCVARDGTSNYDSELNFYTETKSAANATDTSAIEMTLHADGALQWGGGPPLASSAQTGTGSLVLSASPTLTGIPELPASYAVGGNTITQPATAGTLALTSQLPLTGATDSIGGMALAAGQCASGTATVAGASTGEAVVATPTTYPGEGIYWEGYVSAPGTVTVKACATVAATPGASVYQVRVLP